MKKVLSFVLSVAMVICLMPVMAFADDTAPATATEDAAPAATETVTGLAQFSDADSITNEYKEAVAVLVGLGIIDGMGDGTFQPKGDLTRAQASKLVATLVKGGDKSDIPAPATDPFTDVSKDYWGAGAIQFGVENGYINGMGDGTFHPEDKVTTAQLATMLCKLLGYSVEDINYHWPENAMAKANVPNTDINGDISDGITVLLGIGKAADENLNREEAAKMIYNALRSNTKVKSSTSGSGSQDVLGNSSYENVINGIDKDYRSVGRDSIQQLIEKYFPDVTWARDEFDAFRRPTTVWKNGKTNITEESVEEPVLTYTAQEVSSTDANKASDKLYKDLDGYVARDAEVIVNGVTYRGISSFENNGHNSDRIAEAVADYTGNGKLVELYANEKGTEIETVIVADYELLYAKPNAKKKTVSLYSDKDLRDQVGVDVNNRADYYSAIASAAKGDFVLAAINDNGRVIDAYLPKSVESVAITDTNNPTKTWLEDDNATIGEKVYYYQTNNPGGNNGDGVNVDPSDFGTAYLDKYGYLVAYLKENKNPADWALLESIYVIVEHNEVGEALENWFAMVVNEDGTIDNLPLMYLDEEDDNYDEITNQIVENFMTDVEEKVASDTKNYAQIGNNWFSLSGELITYSEAAAGYKLRTEDAADKSWPTDPGDEIINTKTTKVGGDYLSDPYKVVTVSGKKASTLTASASDAISKTYDAGEYKYVTKKINNNTLVTTIFVTGATDETLLKVTKTLGEGLYGSGKVGTKVEFYTDDSTDPQMKVVSEAENEVVAGWYKVKAVKDGMKLGDQVDDFIVDNYVVSPGSGDTAYGSALTLGIDEYVLASDATLVNLNPDSEIESIGDLVAQIAEVGDKAESDPITISFAYEEVEDDGVTNNVISQIYVEKN